MRRLRAALLPGALVLGSAGFAAPLPPSAATASKIDPRLLGGPPDAAAGVIVVLADRADLSGARFLPRRADKGRFVIDGLRRAAARAQEPVGRYLAARGVPYRSLWIVNALTLRADRLLQEELAARPDVLRILADAPVPLRLPPTPPDERRAPRQTATVQPNLTAIGAPDVWAAGVTGQGIVVGAADTGVDWTHPALKEKYRGWNGTTATHAYNWHDAVHDASASNPCGSDAPAPCDDGNHGTHVTGIMLGDDGAGNQIGVAPGAKWIACRNMDVGNGTPARYLECFQWFLAPTDANDENPDPSKAPDVVNNSWSCPPDEGCTDPTILQDGVDALRAAGIVVVAAAGNSGPDCGTIEVPARYESAIAAGATNDTGDLASFSSRGPVPGGSAIKPDVLAPGSEIYSSFSGGGYGRATGTSMSSPHVSGVAALVLSASPSLAGDVDTLETILERTATPISSSDTCGGLDPSARPNDATGWGQVDAAAAYAAVRCPPPTPRIEAAASVPPDTAGLAASVAALPAHAYDWTLTGGTLGSGQGTGAITFTSGSAGGTISLSVTDAFAGCRSAGSLVIAVDFLDVPPSYPFHDAIAGMDRRGISSGCGGGRFCPEDGVTRAQMAVFALRLVHGSAYKPPPATGNVFADVPLGTFLGDWIERFAAEGFTQGCGPGRFCPADPVTRAGAAVFLLRAKHGAAYHPPAASGAVFDDVPAGAFLADWIEELAAEHVTAGCAPSLFCPNDPVSRGEMAAFVARGFPEP